MEAEVLHKKKILAPKLRFKEFSGEWKTKKYSELTSLVTNGFVGKAKDFYVEANGITYIQGYNVIEGGFNLRGIKQVSVDFHKKNKKSDLVEGDLLTIQTGDIGTTTIVTKELAGSNCHALIISRFKSDLASPYFYMLLFNSQRGRNQLKKIETGSTMKHLNVGDIIDLIVQFPTLPEQKKIASFLSEVDEKIHLLTRKKELLEQYKKGVMQQLFSGKLRFKDENRKDYPKWEEKKLGDVLDYIQPTKYLVSSTEYDDSHSTPVLTAGKTFILGYTNETNDIFDENLPVILFDDFTTATQFVDFPFKAKSSAMKILVPKKDEVLGFIYEAMRLIKFEIGGHGRHWISQYALLNIPYPCIEEQKKIADFLSSFDTKLENLNNQITQTQIFKKGLLQQMFV